MRQPSSATAPHAGMQSAETHGAEDPVSVRAAPVLDEEMRDEQGLEEQMETQSAGAELEAESEGMLLLVFIHG